MPCISRPVAALALLAALTACAPAPRVAEPTDTATIGLPAPARGAAHFGIDADASDVEVRIFRGGRLARLGHNHVIEISGLAGAIMLAPDPAKSTASLSFDVAAMVVDEAARRAAAGEGFDTEPSESDIAGTRRNMLSEALLDGENHPTIELGIAAVERAEASDAYSVTLLATVKGSPYRFTAPASLERSGTQLVVSGEFTLLQTALGLTPFSVALGALTVQDEMQIRYRIVATRADDS